MVQYLYNAMLHLPWREPKTSSTTQQAVGVQFGYLTTTCWVSLVLAPSNFATLQGGAIFANLNSTLISNGSISFTNNGNHINIFSINYQVSHGGAMYLGICSTFSVFPHTNVCWENNHATLGGAIYVSDVNPLTYCTPNAPFISREKCFFQLSDQKLSGGLHVQFVFKTILLMM